jgi:hypothetical protein
LDRFREYVSEFKSLVEAYDETPHEWQYFQTEWVWLLVRGLIGDQTATQVKERRHEELKKMERGESQSVTAPQCGNVPETQSGPIAQYVMTELVNGVADGRVLLVELELPEHLRIPATSIDGNPVELVYRRTSVDIHKVVPYPVWKRTRSDFLKIRNEFNGTPSLKYVFVQNPEETSD